MVLVDYDVMVGSGVVRGGEGDDVNVVGVAAAASSGVGHCLQL